MSLSKYGTGGGTEELQKKLQTQCARLLVRVGAGDGEVTCRPTMATTRPEGGGAYSFVACLKSLDHWPCIPLENDHRSYLKERHLRNYGAHYVSFFT